jgi:hypothetical protein
VAAAAGFAAPDVPLDEGAGQGEPGGGELGGDGGGAGLLAGVGRHAAIVARTVRAARHVLQY